MAISIAESIHIGLTDILTRKVRSIVTIVGIILGVMSIMVVLAIVNGMSKSTLSWMQERGGTNKVEVHRNWQWDFRKGGKDYFTLNEIEYIQSLFPEVKAFSPTVRENQIEIKVEDIVYNSDVYGVMPDMVISDEWTTSQGRFINDLDVNESSNIAILGSTVATELFASQNPLGRYISIGGQKLMVVGIMTEKYLKPQGGEQAFSENSLEYMNNRVFVPLSTMLHKISPSQNIGSFEIKTFSPEQAKTISTKLESVVLNLRQGKEIFSVTSMEEQIAAMKQNSMIFTAIFVMIAVISLLVGGIVIMNIMLASIKERTREIGVRLAIGARRMDIFLQFLVQTLLITAMGGILGIIIGFSILDMVGNYLQIAVLASVQMIWISLAVSVGVGLIFGIAPAVRASNLDPVIALRED